MIRRWPGRLVALVALVAGAALLPEPPPAAAQEIVLGGQVRPRFEYRDSLEVGDDAFTSSRVRASLDARLERLRIFIQLQDVRIWGEETSTLGDFSADQLDLHQGYLELERRLGGTVLWGRAGRQEVALGGERLVGAVNWAQQARAFDGLRVGAKGSAGRVDLFAAQLADATASTAEADAMVLGAHGAVERVGPGSLEVLLLHDREDGSPMTRRTTLGGRWLGRRGRLSYRGEVALQSGSRGDEDVTAWLLGLRLGMEVAGGAGEITLWYDRLSGDDDPGDGELRAFDTLFATNHKFYGFADFFLDVPRDTGGRGLQDAAVKGRWRLAERWSLGLDVHAFRLSEARGLASGRLGEELDLLASAPLVPGLEAQAGVAYLLAGEGFGEIGRFRDDVLWTYIMLDATF